MKAQSAAVPPHHGRPPGNAPGLLKFRLSSLGSTQHEIEPTNVILTERDLRRGETLHLMALEIISPGEACQLLKVGRSQLYKLLAKYRQGGVPAIASRKRGRPSNRAYSKIFRKKVLAIVQELYSDYGPTLAAEMLKEVHDMAVSRRHFAHG